MRESPLFFSQLPERNGVTDPAGLFCPFGKSLRRDSDSGTAVQFHKSRVGFAEPALACLWLCAIRFADSRQSIR